MILLSGKNGAFTVYGCVVLSAAEMNAEKDDAEEDEDNGNGNADAHASFGSRTHVTF